MHHQLKNLKQYEIKASSGSVSKQVHKRAEDNPPVIDRVSRAVVPFEQLKVGQSIWIDLDVTDKRDWQAALASMRMYNSKLDSPFVSHKHRGDMRKSGFKYLEIGRIK